MAATSTVSPALRNAMTIVDENQQKLGDQLYLQLTDGLKEVNEEFERERGAALQANRNTDIPDLDLLQFDLPMIPIRAVNDSGRPAIPSPFTLTGRGLDYGSHPHHIRSLPIMFSEEQAAGLHRMSGVYLNAMGIYRAVRELAVCKACGRRLLEDQSKVGWVRRVTTGRAYCCKRCADGDTVDGGDNSPLAPL